ncbi:Antibiotic biosynthesis monooxygenase [Jannaschia faecimaris]|uniref:Antibiotic biosynthesis monooxygenase n=1 Tax=Jannaschia faecimaris TaxID=1244108 RepID=A0A1H3TGP6_9RHOB|nr:antibiotic biosynthesis monooxygenase [Jannaschia faecimaris]SDZ49463.1 Antibiotic biosynthesis monooxygenase [Jannaschia faecimaris]
MIIRIFQVLVRPGKESAFSDFFHRTAIPLMRGTDGIISVLPGAARPESPREFSFVMVWKDIDALKRFAGEDYQNPHIDPAEAELVQSRSIKHYDLVQNTTHGKGFESTESL